MATSSTEAQYVTFSLDKEVFAIPVTVVREILDHEDSFRIPNGPEYMLGLRDVRGQGVPVIDLRLRLGMSATIATPNTRVLVIDIPLEDRTLTLGLVADRVFEVAAFNRDEVEPAPEIGTRWQSGYIEGVVRRDGGFVVIIDLARLLSEGEISALANTGRGTAAA